MSLNLEHILEVAAILRRHGERLAVAESCTGGAIAAAFTAVPGISEIFEEGIVAYTAEAKMARLGVSDELLRAYGTVDPRISEAMLRGLAPHQGKLQAGIASTGLAGPSNGGLALPVGTLYLSVFYRERVQTQTYLFKEQTRQAFIEAAVQQAIRDLLSLLRAYHDGQRA